MPSGFRYFITLITILIIPFVSHAQYRNRVSFWDGFTVSGLAGVNFFYGDLVDKSRTSFSGGVVAEREFNTYLLGRFQLMGGKMKGIQSYTSTDNNQDILSASFTNMYVDAALGVSFRPLDLILGYYKQRPINPYVFVQGGIIYYDATEDFHEGYPVPNAPDRIRSGISPQVSFGPGLSYWLNPRLSIRAELNGTYIFGDEVDAHKEWETPNGTVHITKDNDYYYTVTAGITYLISDSRWKNDPKYNRKAYLQTRSPYRRTNVKSSHKRKIKKSRHKRYKPRRRRR